MTTCFRRSRRTFSTRSKYQRIEVFRDPVFGHILSIDGDIQLSELDEANYHEMLVHVPMAYVPGASSVLIIGGGDGGALREACKYPGLERIVMVELDEAVVRTATRFFRRFRSGFADPRVTLHIVDAFDYLRNAEGELFDAVFVDLTDFRHSDKLFTAESIALLKDRMRPASVLSLNFYSVGVGEHNPTEQLRDSGFGRAFAHKRLYLSHQPVFTGGLYAFALLSDQIPAEPFPDAYPVEYLGLETEYYTPAIHEASFALPKRLA